MLFVGGIFSGYMDCIQPMNWLRKKGYLYTKEAMEASKDLNKDGKVSWTEGSFPIDKWHVYKRRMNYFFSTGSTFWLWFTEVHWSIKLLAPLAAFIAISSGFLLIWGKGVKGKLAIILAILLVQSCSITRHKTVSENKSDLKTDSCTEIDVKTTENLDTNITLPADTNSFDFNDDDTSEQVFKTPQLTATVSPGKKPGSHKLTIIQNKKVIPVKINKETNFKQKSNVSRNLKNDSKGKEVVTEKKGMEIPFWVWLLIIAGVLLYLSFRWRNR